MFRKITTPTLITLSYLILASKAWPQPTNIGEVTMTLTSNYTSMYKLLTLLSYLFGISAFYLAFYRLGAVESTPTKKSILLPVTLILAGVLSFIVFLIAMRGNIFSNFAPTMIYLCLGSILICTPVGFYILGKRKARTTKPNMTITIILFVIGVLLLVTPTFLATNRPIGPF